MEQSMENDPQHTYMGNNLNNSISEINAKQFEEQNKGIRIARRIRSKRAGFA